MANVLDLKKDEPEEASASDGHDVIPPSEPEEQGSEPESAPDPIEAELTSLLDYVPEAVSWEASTKPDALERRKEHILLGVLGVIAVVIAIWQRSFPLIAIAGLTILVWEVQHRHGHDVRVDIDRNGVGVNGRRHRFDRLKSYAIQELPDGSHHLSIMPAGMFSPAIRAPLGEQDHEPVRAILSANLVEDEHDIPVSELFLKS